MGVYVGTGWSDWYDYIPGYSADPCFGLNNNKDLPYDATWLIVDVECYATKPGMEDSPVTKFMWRIERPAWHDFAFDKLHDAGENFPRSTATSTTSRQRPTISRAARWAFCMTA